MTASVSSIRVVQAAGPAPGAAGRYRYIAMLAEGGMADVYLAVTQNMGFEKLVVIKQLRATLAEDPTFVAMFMDEARLAARLNHPNVVQTLEVGTDPTTGLHFLAMEFLEGVPYVRFARLKDRVPPPLAFHIRILIDVLRGLHYAHELRDFDGTPLSVVHRDVSPQNVMLTFAGGVKVLDFGIAKAELAVEQRPEDFKGKLEYMAPEQALRQEVDRRADVFSVGVMLFEALTRRRLYRKGDQKHELLVTGKLPNVLDVAPTAPKRLAAICAKAMSFDRDARYPTADAMADDIEDWLGNTTQHVSARDVGSFVAEKFASTRSKISAAIEAQLALFRSLPETAPDTLPLSRLPNTDLPSDFSDIPPPMSIPPAMLPTFPTSDPSLPNASRLSGSGMVAAATGWGRPPMLGQAPSPLDATGPHWLSPAPHGMAPPAAGGSAEIATVNAPRLTRPASGPPGKPRQALAAIVTLFAVLVIGGSVVVAARAKSRRTGHDATAAASGSATPVTKQAPLTTASGAGLAGGPASAPTSSTAAPAPEEAQIELTIKASPPEARIFLDGSPVATNPTSGSRPRDGAIHLIRIEAPGYEPREESVGFDRSVYINLELHPAGAPAEATSASRQQGRGVRQGQRVPRPRPAGGAKAIDPENPY